MNINLKKIVKTLLALNCLAALFVSGCQSVPDGMPPVGSIVEIEPANDNKVLTLNEAIDDMTTALASISLTQKPDNSLPTLAMAPTAAPEAYKTQLGQLTVMLYRELLKTEVFDIDVNGNQDYTLTSVFMPEQVENFVKKNKEDKVFKWQAKLNERRTGKTLAERSVNVCLLVKDIKETDPAKF